MPRPALLFTRPARLRRAAYLVLLLLGCGLYPLTWPLRAEPVTWADLERPDYVGSERERKIRVDALVVEEDSWSDHYSLGILGLFRHTDYPAFTETRFLPIYWSLESKLDERSRGLLVPAFFYSHGSDEDYFWLSPIGLWSSDRYDTGNSFLHLYGWLFASFGRRPAPELSAPDRAASEATERAAQGYALLPLGYVWSDGVASEAWFGPAGFSSGESYGRAFLLPLVWADWSAEHRSVISPFAYYADQTSREGTNIAYDTTLAIPVLPLYYAHDSSSDGSERLVLNTYWARDEHQNLRSVWSVPFFLYRDGPDGYLHLPPLLYFAPVRDGEREQLSFSPLHYYHVRDRQQPTKRETFWMLAYYKHLDQPADVATSMILPLYFDFHTPESDVHLALPAYISYQDATRSIHINAGGISVSSEKIGLPRFGRDAENDWYLDQDVALFYNLLRVSTRLSLGATESPAAGPDGRTADTADTADAPDFARPDFAPARTEPAADPDSARLAKSNDTSRDTARQYFGITALCGLWAYKAADTSRHIRVLPLGWLSWDETSDDRAQVVPGLFLSYRRADLEYFVLFPAFVPLYGRQREGDSYLESYLTLTYTRSYDAATQTREHSIFWPLLHAESSPRHEYRRVLPLLRYSASLDENTGAVRESSLFAPLFYYGADQESTTHTLLPVYYSSTRQLAAGRQESMLLALPGAYYHSISDGDRTESSEFISPWYHHIMDSTTQQLSFGVLGAVYGGSERSYGRTVTDAARAEAEPTRQAWERHVLFGLASVAVRRQGTTAPESSWLRWWLAPLYYHSDWQNRRYATASRTDISPLFYHHSTTGPTATQRQLVAPLFYLQSDERETVHTFLPVYYSHAEQLSPERTLHSFLALPGVYYQAVEENEETLAESLYSPLYHRTVDTRAGTRSFGILGALYGGESSEVDGRTSWDRHALYGLAAAGTADEVATHSGRTHWWLAPLYYHQTYFAPDVRGHTELSPLFYYDRQEYQELASSVLILPGFYRARDNAATHTNVLGLLDWAGDDTQLGRMLALPVFGYLHEESATTYFLAGYYRRRAPEYARDNVLYLYDREHFESTRQTSHEMLLGSLSLQKGPEFLSLAAGYGLLAGVDVRTNQSINWNVGWMLHKSTPHSVSNWFLPLWAYESARASEETGSGERFWMVLPALSVSRRTPHTGYDYLAGGLLYAHSYDRPAGEKSTRALLGALYEDLRTPEKGGYHVQGSLWGLLWQYEEERDTNFSRFSVLKSVYSRTRIDGHTHTRIFGIRVASEAGAES